MLCADDRITFASRWDPHWTVAKVFGKAQVNVNDKSQDLKTFSRDMVRLGNPRVNWDEVNMKTHRSQLNQIQLGDTIFLKNRAGH